MRAYAREVLRSWGAMLSLATTARAKSIEMQYQNLRTTSELNFLACLSLRAIQGFLPIIQACLRVSKQELYKHSRRYLASNSIFPSLNPLQCIQRQPSSRQIKVPFHLTEGYSHAVLSFQQREFLVQIFERSSVWEWLMVGFYISLITLQSSSLHFSFLGKIRHKILRNHSSG